MTQEFGSSREEQKIIAEDRNISKKDQNAKTSLLPFGFKIIVREVWRDKVAFAPFYIIAAILLFTPVGSLSLNSGRVTETNTAEACYRWGESGHALGTDDGSCDILKLLMMGGRNSILVGLFVTVLREGVGLLAGLFSGYFGGVADVVIMRIVDFIQILPQSPIIIVLTTVIPNYNVGTLVLLISVSGWTLTVRYFCAFVLPQREREYVLVSKTSGSSNLIIILREVLLNITSALIIDVILIIAGNIGTEATSPFLGYGLSTTTPSLGTLIGFANDPANVITRSWLWIPAAILLLIIPLNINYVGHTLQRTGDVRQREN